MRRAIRLAMSGILRSCSMNAVEAVDLPLLPERIVCLEPGTCSARATLFFLAQHGARASEVELCHCSSFADAASLLRKRKSPRDLLFLPHLHELVADLTLSEEFLQRSDLAFWLENPPLFLARGRAGGRELCQSANITHTCFARSVQLCRCE